MLFRYLCIKRNRLRRLWETNVHVQLPNFRRGKIPVDHRFKLQSASFLWKFMINELLQSRTESARQRSSAGGSSTRFCWAKPLCKVTTFEKRPKLLWCFSCRKTLLFRPVRTLLGTKQDLCTSEKLLQDLGWKILCDSVPYFADLCNRREVFYALCVGNKLPHVSRMTVPNLMKLVKSAIMRFMVPKCLHCLASKKARESPSLKRAISISQLTEIRSGTIRSSVRRSKIKVIAFTPCKVCTWSCSGCTFHFWGAFASRS